MPVVRSPQVFVGGMQVKNMDAFGANRRSFLRNAAFAGAAATIASFCESQFALAQVRHHETLPGNAVLLNSNENPLGPCEAARAAMIEAVSQSGRYHDEYSEQLTNLFASQNGLKPEYIQPYSGSSQPIAYAVFAFCNAQKGVVMGTPGYESASSTAKTCGTPVFSVPLTTEGAHDVRAMVAANTGPGLYYIANPNNPTGTITSRADIEWLLVNKPQGSIVMVDEAYIHFSDATPCLDLVAPKGHRRASHLQQTLWHGGRTAWAGDCASRSAAANQQYGWVYILSGARDESWDREPERAGTDGEAQEDQCRCAAADFRLACYQGIHVHGFTGELLHDRREASDPDGDRRHGIARACLVGRPWPVWPTHVRITVGTADEMSRFRTAFQQVMEKPAAAAVRRHSTSRTARFS